MLNPRVRAITERITARSEKARAAYREKIREQAEQTPPRRGLSCGNMAHAFAASPDADKRLQAYGSVPNIGIVSAYNDMLSAHQPYARYPDAIKNWARELGATAQVAGGVPAMCDGITQGRAGMELSLFSRDVIAMATAVSLSHQVFDGVVALGICDKIVPGLLIGAASFGHLPTIFLPSGPMPTGLSNEEKVRVRQDYAAGKASQDELYAAECASYHSPGTCTFYGTANSNQLLLDIMGLHLPGAAFVAPDSPLREALNREAIAVLCDAMKTPGSARLADILSVKTLVNGLVGLLASGGSTNHTIHLNAIARAAGVILTWQDLSDLSAVVPLLCRIYPNGSADINRFHDAGGTPYLIRELRDAGLLHDDVMTVLGESGLTPYTKRPEWLEEATLELQGASGRKLGRLVFRDSPRRSADPEVLATGAEPFQNSGGLNLLTGNLGRAVMKVSAVKPEHRMVEAPARVFVSQDAFSKAFAAGELHRDVVAVLRFQGPKANGMPELHELTPKLGVLQNAGYRVALVTDGRMSGASGKVPAAIHLSPEAADGGDIAKIQDGDILRVDGENGVLEALVDADEWAARTPAVLDTRRTQGAGRELFLGFRQQVSCAEAGGSFFRAFDFPETALDDESESLESRVEIRG